jgi:signal transduction histidine kinase
LGLDPRPFNLADSIWRVIRSLKAADPGRYTVAASAELPAALGDPRRVEQVVVNLLTNASKYAPTGSLVRVTIGQLGTALMVSVEDEGPGIPPDDRARIFEPFFRLPEGQRAGIPGRGLGLALCRLLVEAQSGRIWVESGYTASTAFRFTLPVADAKPALATGEQALLA